MKGNSNELIVLVDYDNLENRYSPNPDPKYMLLGKVFEKFVEETHQIIRKWVLNYWTVGVGGMITISFF